MAKIGGVKVSDGGEIHWKTLIGILVGAPVYAYYVGIISTIQAWTDGVLAGVRGLRETAVEFVSSFFGGIAHAFARSETSFISSVEAANLGPFTFAFTVAVAVLSLWAFLKGIQMARRGING